MVLPPVTVAFSCSTNLRPTICASFSTCGTLRTQPAGTPLALNSVSHSAADLPARAASSSRFSAARWSLRDCRSRNRGSDFSSGFPTMSQSASYCFCSLAAMLSGPEPVANVPDGAAVKFSLPIGCGSTLPLRWLETTQPIAARVDFEQRDIDLPPAPGLPLLDQSGRDRKGCGETCDGVGDRKAGAQGRRVRHRP